MMPTYCYLYVTHMPAHQLLIQHSKHRQRCSSAIGSTVAETRSMSACLEPVFMKLISLMSLTSLCDETPRVHCRPDLGCAFRHIPCGFSRACMLEMSPFTRGHRCPQSMIRIRRVSRVPDARRDGGG